MLLGVCVALKMLVHFFLLMQLMLVRYSVPRVLRDALNAQYYNIGLLVTVFFSSSFHSTSFSLPLTSRPLLFGINSICMFTDYAF